MRNPSWTRDEIILALEFYLLHRDISIPGKDSDEIRELSAQIRKVATCLGLIGDDKFRNANGVYMKVMNLRSHDPVYLAQGKVGLKASSALEAEIWADYAHYPDRLNDAANLIREYVHSGCADASEVPISELEMSEAIEGRFFTRLHVSRERSAKLVAMKKKEAIMLNGRLACEACGFEFKTMYGERGRDFIECHHTLPVNEMTPGSTTKLKDLALLCANCHRMIHTKRPWLTLPELKALIYSKPLKP